MEQITVTADSKEERYRQLLPQLRSVVQGESDPIANMANVSAMLKEVFNFWWVGFYRVVGDRLLLGPFQGPLACTRIARGRGVCGTAWAQAATIVVPDVDKFPGHIACSSASRSEIVVPLFSATGEVCAVLDIDSELPGHFDETDRIYLEQIAALL